VREVNSVEPTEEQREQVQEIIDFAGTLEFSHLVLRDLTAGQTGEWMAYIAYRKEPTSPTGVLRHSSTEATKYARQAFKEAGLTTYHGPQHGEMAARRWSG